MILKSIYKKSKGIYVGFDLNDIIDRIYDRMNWWIRCTLKLKMR